MRPTAVTSSRRLPYLVRVIRGRPRLSVSLLAAVVVLLLLPARWWVTTRLLMAWDLGITLYLLLVYQVIVRAEVGHIRQYAAIEDEGRFEILVLTASAALASLGAIIVELASAPNAGPLGRPAQLILATLTILLSWIFTHTIFALHYAHEFYDENDENGGGLVFPGGEEPDYWDFVYFSFVIGMTSQVSDVAVTNKSIRRTVTVHGVLSFVFNAALLALTVNIAASAI